jgi:hypothetical protein
MRFRLTYEGVLPATQNDPRDGQRVKNAEVKHEIRRVLHRQLRHLWRSHPALQSWKVEASEKDRIWRYQPLYSGESAISGGGAALPRNVPAWEALSDQFQCYGYKFAPLVWKELDVIASLDILFLRRGRPGKLFSEGDVDNRIKTIIDCLRQPNSENEVPVPPEKDEEPFFVLLQDDKYLSNISVETDELHDPLDDNHKHASKARLIISVEVRPWQLSIMNVHFV